MMKIKYFEEVHVLSIEYTIRKILKFLYGVISALSICACFGFVGTLDFIAEGNTSTYTETQLFQYILIAGIISIVFFLLNRRMNHKLRTVSNELRMLCRVMSRRVG